MSFEHKYSEYYDLFYKKKDYEAEARFVLQLAEIVGVKPCTILDLGCGTGRHAIEWARLGIEVRGIEGSESMYHQAATRIPKEYEDLISFSLVDLRKFEIDKCYDIVTAMFAVLGYIGDEADLIDLFKRIYDALRPGGLFVCDTWNGAAVFREGPGDRMTVFDLPEGRLYRFASSRMIPHEQICVVHYTLVDTANSPGVYEEDHSMRFFSTGEMRLLAKASGMELVRACPFMQKDRELTLSDWNASWVFQRTV